MSKFSTQCLFLQFLKTFKIRIYFTKCIIHLVIPHTSNFNEIKCKKMNGQLIKIWNIFSLLETDTLNINDLNSKIIRQIKMNFRFQDSHKKANNDAIRIQYSHCMSNHLKQVVPQYMQAKSQITNQCL